MIRDFINQMEEKGYIVEDIVFFLEIKKLFEKQNRKDVGKFDIDTVNIMLSLMSPAEETEEIRLIDLFKEYLKWTGEDIAFDIRKIEITHSTYLVQKDLIPIEEEILDEARSLDNVLDKIILMGPYYGIGGTGMSELLDIRSKDINYYTKQVAISKTKIDPVNKTIVTFSSEMIQWMKEAIECYSCDDMKFIKDDYLIKRQVGSKRDDRKKMVDKRLTLINEQLCKDYTFSQLRRFGIINAFRDSVKEYGVNMESLLSTNPGKEIMTQYSYPAQRKTILIKKYKQYVD